MLIMYLLTTDCPTDGPAVCARLGSRRAYDDYPFGSILRDTPKIDQFSSARNLRKRQARYFCGQDMCTCI
jgi:hypothetical protein